MRAVTRLLAAALGALLVAGCATVPDVGPVAAVDDAEAGTLTVGKREFRIRYDDLRYSGDATFTWPDGRRYQGELRSGRPHGRGVEARPDGSLYAGEWRFGRRQGFGRLTLADGSRYEGRFADDQRAGTGIFTGPPGRYVGEWADDVPHGAGRFEYGDGSVYEGRWSAGRREGWGRFDRPDGRSRYEGDWQNDLPHGFGLIVDHGGFTYEGGFDRGQRSGYGALDFGEGVGYAGMWLAGQRQGWGRETRPDGSVYEGEWRADRRHGTGVDRHLDGSFHDGAFENGRPLGPGRRHSAEGTEITGLWNGDTVANGFVKLPDGGEYAGPLYDARRTAVATRFLHWLEVEAQDGSAQAALLLGDAHRLFEDPSPDPATATYWYRLAADRGSAEAAFRLAEMTVATEGPNEDALALLARAAAQAHGAANTLLGSFHQLGNHLARDHALARRYYEVAMRAGDLVARNNLAWLLATSPDDHIRNGALAVRLVRPMALLYDHWTYLDTLAAAAAEAGDFDAARQNQRRAVALATGDAAPDTIADLEARLALYEASHAYREW